MIYKRGQMGEGFYEIYESQNERDCESSEQKVVGISAEGGWLELVWD